MTKLTELIESLIEEKTFSLEGVKAIEEMRQKAAAQEARIEATANEIKEARLEILSLETANSKLATAMALTEKREHDLAAREKAAFENEKKAAVSTAESSAYKHAFEIVFRSNTVRETIHHSVPVARNQPGGYSNVEYHSETKTVAREEGS